MGQIQVSIPEKGGATVVLPDRKAVLPGETLTWHVCCENPEVQSVKIEFVSSNGNGATEMFGVHPKGSPTHIVKELQVGDGCAKSCTISVHVPMPEDQVRTDKYRVVGVDAQGNEIGYTELDPQIITPKPGGGG